jgi:hypothetical protein
LLKNELLKHSIIDVRSDCDSTESVQILQRCTPHSLFKYTHKVPHSVGGGSYANASSPLFSTSPLSAGLFFYPGFGSFITPQDPCLISGYF